MNNFFYWSGLIWWIIIMLIVGSFGLVQHFNRRTKNIKSKDITQSQEIEIKELKKVVEHLKQKDETNR